MMDDEPLTFMCNLHFFFQVLVPLLILVVQLNSQQLNNQQLNNRQLNNQQSDNQQLDSHLKMVSRPGHYETSLKSLSLDQVGLH